jgi:hypothetical protein
VPFPNVAVTATAKKQAALKTAPAVKPALAQPIAGATSIAPINRGTSYQMGTSKVDAEGKQIQTVLDGLHQKMRNMTSSDPTEWQNVLQAYASAAAALFVTTSP